MRTVIFDLDGTLADTSGDLIAAANVVFARLGQGAALDPVADAATAFRGGRAMLRLGFSRGGLEGAALEALIEVQFQPFVEAYTENIDVYSTMYPGAVTAVEGLVAAGYKVGICTNKPGRQAEILMTRLGVRGLFASLVGADTLPVRKPDPAPYAEAVARAGGALRRSLLVGDTITDRDTARAAGVPCVLVGFGPEGRAVAALKPDALLDGYDDLAGVVARLIG